MKKKSSLFKKVLNSLTFLSFLILGSFTNELKAQCAGVIVPTPTVDVRGNVDLCVNSQLELCPLVWGYSNFQWYKDGQPFSTNSCVTVNTTGSYTLAAQDGAGCWSSQSTPVTVVGNGSTPATPTISTSSALSFCSGGSAVLTSSALSGNQWYKDGILINGATNPTLTVSETGNYTAAAINCGSSSAASNAISIIVTQSPTVSNISGNNNLCVNQTSQLTNATSGGVWNSSNTAVATISATGLVSALSSGTSTITYTVTDGLCSNSSTISIYVAPNNTPIIDVRGNTSLCVNSTVELCPQNWGFSNYEWFKDGLLFSTNSCINVSESGVYTLRGQNSSACWSGLSLPVTITGGVAPSTPVISTSSSTTFCQGGSAILTSNLLTGNQWYKDGVIIVGATAQNYTATETGVYTSIGNNCGSSSTASNSITITVNPNPSIPNITGTTQICQGLTSQLTNSVVGGTWSSSNNSVASINNAGLVTSLSAGNATINYTVVTGVCTATISTDISVLANTTPIIQVSGPTTLCNNTTTTLCPTTWGASNFQWFKDGISFSTDACLTLNAAGSYTLQTISGSCTTAISTPVVITNGVPPAATTISAASATTFCEGGSVVLNSTVGANYQWQNNGSNISGATSQSYLATTSGNYTVVVNGCGSATSNALSITVNPAPIVDNINGVSTVCLGLSTIYTNTTSGGTWSSSNTSVATVDVTGLITTIAAGTTTISYTVTNAGCTTIKTRVLTVFPSATAPTINPRGSTTLCQGNTVMMCPLNWGYSNYQWYKDGVAFSTSSCITVAEAGAYTLAGQNGAGCWSDQSSPITVIVNPLPIVVASTGLNSVCVGSTIQLTNASVVPVGGSSAWSSTNSRATVNASGLVTGINSGAVGIRYTVINSFNCSAFTELAATVNSLPAIPNISFASGYSNPFAGGSNFCTNRTFGLVGSPATGVWSATGAASVTVAGIVTTAATAGSGSITYTVTNANGCSSSRTIPGNVVACSPRGNVQNNAVLTSDNDINLFPNPTSNILQINMTRLVNEGNVLITDATGKIIKTQKLSIGLNKIDVSNFANGIYFINYQSNEKMSTKKFIKN